MAEMWVYFQDGIRFRLKGSKCGTEITNATDSDAKEILGSWPHCNNSRKRTKSPCQWLEIVS